jgi:hypothetical protein
VIARMNRLLKIVFAGAAEQAKNKGFSLKGEAFGKEPAGAYCSDLTVSSAFS